MFAVLSLALMCTSSAIRGDYFTIGGTLVLFGYGQVKISDLPLSSTNEEAVLSLDGLPACALPLIGWCLILAGTICAFLASIFPLFKRSALNKSAAIVNIVGSTFLVVGGCFSFFADMLYQGGNLALDALLTQNHMLGYGWIVAGCFAIIAGIINAVPSTFDFIDHAKP